MITSNLTLALILSLLYAVGLAVLYFSKARMDNIENRIYKFLIVINLVGLCIQILCNYLCIHQDSIPSFITNTVLAIFTTYFTAWVNTMLDYVFAIAFPKNRKIIWINIVLTVIECLLVMFLPFKLYSDKINNIYYTYGMAVNLSFILSGIIIGLMIILMLFRIKYIKIKKILPIVLFIIFGIIAATIQHYNPHVLIIAPAETFICALMYFTIENPDIKMIEQLNIERDRADKANNAKTEFLSSMSHEIRTPLNAIDGFSQLILEENNLDVIKDEAKDIMAASQNLLEIVNGILDISKIEADKLEIVNVEYEPVKIFEEVGKLAKSRIGEKPVEFKVHIAEDLPDYLYGDYSRIKQITLNLLTNAVKYTKDGYVDYSVRCVRQNDICRLIIMVKDTGIGIKTENINKLFNKFERFDKEQNITIEGTGLGLAITKKLVDLMNGRIIADSRYGTGSIFAVVIDQRIVNRVKDKTVTEVTNSQKSFSGARILVVDDNKINLKVASRLLDSYNIMSETVESGYACIDKIKSGTIYNLILMDDMMPNMSGTETFKKLKQIDGFNIPVIALTANAIAGMKEKYLSEGFNDYISKPIDKKELERVLNTYLN